MLINHTEIIKVRISDLNYGNHLGHTQLIDLAHEARVQFLKKLKLKEHDIQNNALVIRDLVVRYFSQAFLDNELEFKIKLECNGNKVIFIYDVYNLTCNKKTAEIIATMVLIDKNTFKPLKSNLVMDILINEKFTITEKEQ